MVKVQKQPLNNRSLGTTNMLTV